MAILPHCRAKRAAAACPGDDDFTRTPADIIAKRLYALGQEFDAAARA